MDTSVSFGVVSGREIGPVCPVTFSFIVCRRTSLEDQNDDTLIPCVVVSLGYYGFVRPGVLS